MSDWQSLEDVIKEFEIAGDFNDHDDICKILKDMQLAIHPDTSGGAFINQEDEHRYHSLSEAIKYVKRCGESLPATIPVSQLPDLIKAVVEAIPAANNHDNITI